MWRLVSVARKRAADVVRTHAAILDVGKTIKDILRVDLFLEIRAEVVQDERDEWILHHRDHDCDLFIVIDFG